MKYVCLVYGEESILNGMSPADARALTDDSLAYDEELCKSGHFIIAQALMSVRTAKTIRVRDKKLLRLDGPFAETKEQLLGFILIEARDEADALGVAEKIPLAKLGSIEVRQIMELS